MKKYSFDRAAAILERGSQESNAAVAEAEGITRVTLNRWKSKASNDFKGYRNHYGEAYINMYVEGLHEAIEAMNDFYKEHLNTTYNPMSGEGVYLIQAKDAPTIYTTDWYQLLIKDKGTAKERREVSATGLTRHI